MGRGGVCLDLGFRLIHEKWPHSSVAGLGEIIILVTKEDQFLRLLQVDKQHDKLLLSVL